MMFKNENKIVCPGCGWAGNANDLDRWGACPICGYENGVEPYRLLTLSEMLESEVEYNDVRLDLFLQSILNLWIEDEADSDDMGYTLTAEFWCWPFSHEGKGR